MVAINIQREDLDILILKRVKARSRKLNHVKTIPYTESDFRGKLVGLPIGR